MAAGALEVHGETSGARYPKAGLYAVLYDAGLAGAAGWGLTI
jgi:hypothetical protein